LHFRVRTQLACGEGPSDSYFDGIDLEVARQEPGGKTHWTPAYKKLLAQAANDRIAQLLADDRLRGDLLAKADAEVGDVAKCRLEALAQQQEREAREAKAKANALPDAKRLWAELQQQGYAAERLVEIPMDWSPGPDLQGLIHFFADRPSLMGRKVGIFECGNEVINGVRTPIVWCRLPIAGHCSVSLSGAATFAQTWIHVEQPMQRIAFSEHAAYLARGYTDEAKQLNIYRDKGNPEWDCIPRTVYGQIERLICEHPLEHIKALEEQLLLSDAIYEMLGASWHIEKHIGRVSRGAQACSICHRRLQVEGSVWRGIGPECWDRLLKHVPGLRSDWLQAHERRPAPVLRYRPKVLLCKADAWEEAKTLQRQWAMSMEEIIAHLRQAGWLTEKEAGQ